MLSGRSRFAQTAIVDTSMTLALGLLGLALAYWTWAWFAPAPLPRAMQVSEPPGRLAAAGDLFGHGTACADCPRSRFNRASARSDSAGSTAMA